ncbi:hypothetical protein ACEUZ9_001131 [Paracoccus litorisediminis]|uniref:hypothetical protein n=1 Tax=Paracoccus litorisediminis TaxID=2006130 RepID=UPI00372EC391
MKKTIGAIAAILALSAGLAHAETDVRSGFKAGEYETAGSKVDYTGVQVEASGSKEKLNYNLDINVGELDGYTLQSIKGEVAYMVNDYVGPKLTHEWVNSDGTKDTMTFAGITGKYTAAEDLGVYGDVLFGKDEAKVAKIGASYSGLDHIGLWGELDGTDADDILTQKVEVGAKYKIDNVGSVYGKVFHEWDDAAVETKGTGIGAGLSLSF